MGVPALFRWLSRKYPKIILPVSEAPSTDSDGNDIPVDCTLPNPNGEEFDNLYLDMNGIVHPCSHPEDRPPPRNEQEMMQEVFRYTDRIMAMVRPRKLLMIAVDGVAPRAKMNQQRSRRFRSAQEAEEKAKAKAKLVEELVANGQKPPEEGPAPWDSNVITPGTPFMDILASSLRYWVQYKFNTDPAWKNLKVIISDASVPGEGEHKIMEFVRSQRSDPRHDPNTRHVIYGLDADLIMLGLATHEPYFRVLREDVFFGQDNGACHNCGRKGHRAAECTSAPAEKDEQAVPVKKPFIWLNTTVLREYLEAELHLPNQRTPWDLERAIDDWVFIIFFVGNDFLPHLPSLEIREGAIDMLVDLWKRNLDVAGGYITCDGQMDTKKAHFLLEGIAQQESQIFKRRKADEERREQRDKARQRQNQVKRQRREDPAPLGLMDLSKTPAEAAMSNSEIVANRNADVANIAAAAKLKAELLASTEKKDDPQEAGNQTPEPTSEDQPAKKRPFGEFEDAATSTDNATPAEPAAEDDEISGPDDSVKLWEDGYKERYYEQKFHADPRDIDFRRSVARDYIEGLAWVLLYYFQGCPSWTWYYPHHYAPFAADFDKVSEVEISFVKGEPARPYEQLLGVMPTASRHVLPKPLQALMTDEEYGILDFYPLDFPVDLNGKKFAWQGVVLLPFIDQSRLLEACAKGYKLLTDDEMARNQRGHEALYFSEQNEKLYDLVVTRLYRKTSKPSADLDMRMSDGLAGVMTREDDFVPNARLDWPFSEEETQTRWEDLEANTAMVVGYDLPKLPSPHKSMLLRGVVPPQRILDRRDLEQVRYGGGEPRRRGDNDRWGNGNRARDVLDPSQHRHAPPSNGGGGMIPPPWLAGSVPPPPPPQHQHANGGWQGYARHQHFDGANHNGHGGHRGGPRGGRAGYHSHATPRGGQHQQNNTAYQNRYSRVNHNNGPQRGHANSSSRPPQDAWRRH
ncbi:5'-3' exoribonuclease 2 [Savitreella phatthalungensis]